MGWRADGAKRNHQEVVSKGWFPSAWETSMKCFRFSQPQAEIGAAFLHLQGWCDKVWSKQWGNEIRDNSINITRPHIADTQFWKISVTFWWNCISKGTSLRFQVLMSIHNVKAICLFLFNLFVLNWAYSATRKCAQPMAVQKARGVCEHFWRRKGFSVD